MEQKELRKKRVFVVACIYPPESAGHEVDVAEELARRGYEVTVFAPFPNWPGRKVYEGYRRCWRSVSFVNGCRVVRCWHILSGRSTILSRFIENISFGLTSTLQILWDLFTRPRPSVAFMRTWPVFAQNLNSFVLRVWSVPVVTAALDIYPEALLERGILKPNGFITRMMLWFDRLHLRRCQKVFTVSPGLVELLTKTRKLPLSKVEYIPNYVDAAPFLRSVNHFDFRSQHDISPDAFIAMYAGNLTEYAGLELYIKVAEMLWEEDIKILLVGDGTARIDLERKIEVRKLTNIRVIHPLKPTEVPEVQAAADVLLLPLPSTRVLAAVPSKLPYYMLSGKPIIASVPSENYAVKILQESNSGFVVPPEDPTAVAAVLRDIRHKPDLLHQMGENARRFALKEFSRDVVIPKLVDMIESVAQ